MEDPESLTPEAVMSLGLVAGVVLALTLRAVSQLVISRVDRLRRRSDRS